MTINDFCIGSSTASSTAVVTLTSILSEANVPIEPDAEFQTFSGQEDLMDTSRLGVGYSMETWKFAHLSDTQRYTLRQYCNNSLSNQVYMRCPTNETGSDGTHTWHTFLATMIWPSTEKRSVFVLDTDPGQWEDVTVQFRALVQQD